MSIARAALAAMRPPPDASAQEWAKRITTCWNASFEAIVEVGHLLSAAKESLPHGSFGAMIETDLPFTASTAQRLMAISADPRITNPAHAQHLPKHWGTLYELTKLKDDEFEKRIKDGTIKSDMERRDISTIVKQETRAFREQELAQKISALPDKKYGVILADPEWRFEPYSRETGMDRSPDNHYPTSVLDEICARPVNDIAADDSVLFLWATVPMMPAALDVMRAWGFEYKSHCIWMKDRIGTGYWFRNQHELLLVGSRGKIPAPAMGEQWSSVLEAPVLHHSQKPESFYELIEQYFPTLPKIELNARRSRKGWDSWGLEAPTDSFGSEIIHDAQTGEVAA